MGPVVLKKIWNLGPSSCCFRIHHKYNFGSTVNFVSGALKLPWGVRSGVSDISHCFLEPDTESWAIRSSVMFIVRIPQASSINLIYYPDPDPLPPWSLTLIYILDPDIRNSVQTCRSEVWLQQWRYAMQWSEWLRCEFTLYASMDSDTFSGFASYFPWHALSRNCLLV